MNRNVLGFKGCLCVIVLFFISFLVQGCIGANHASNTADTIFSDEESEQMTQTGSDEETLKKIIKEQLAMGAKVDEDIKSEQYNWVGGRLYGIYWSYVGLSGEISFAGLDNLAFLDCSSNNLSKLDIRKNVALVSVDCSDNSLSKLDISKNSALRYLHCQDNNLSELDVSKNPALEELYSGYASVKGWNK